ncbi:MAG: sulfatase [Bacteroidales bacterium]|nr:sulfatase [Bacteroidales bacterium]
MPNILFAISDDQSYFHTSFAGCNWVNTPAFDRVAEQGIFFTNCYTPNAKCAPSRSSIITGRNSWQLEEAGNHVSIFPEKFASVFEVFEQQTDYWVGHTGKGVEPVNSQGRLLAGKAYSSIRLEPPGQHISAVDYGENFKDFYRQKPEDSPFLFWYGGQEPHRAYEYGIGINKGGKSIDQIDKVPGFWPDNEVVRTDMLDYAYEIEYFDHHLGQMIAFLEEQGELENTVIIVTADNGMPFPRCKGIEYEYSNHMPLAILWPAGIKNPGRKIEDYISFIDFAPTFLELAGVENPDMQPIQGKSLVSVFKSPKEGRIDQERNYMILGQERHDVGRPDDVGFPIRSIIMDDLLLIHNFEPDRWPMCNPETGYLNTDGSPTKTEILEMRRRGEPVNYWDLCFGKKPQEELYNIKNDPECLDNLARDPGYEAKMSKMRNKLFEELKAQGDPRMFGNGHVFDDYLYAHEAQRDFYNRYMKGEITDFVTGWVNESDFEKEPVE